MFRLPKLLGGALALALFLGLTMPVVAEEVRGTIRTVNADKNEVVLKGLFKDATYELHKDGKVILDGRTATLADLREGDRACINYNKAGERMIADEVRGLRKATETAGAIRRVLTDRNELVLKGLLRDTTYMMFEDGVVWLNGKESTLSDLNEGDQVILTWEQRGDHLMVSEARATRK